MRVAAELIEELADRGFIVGDQGAFLDALGDAAERVEGGAAQESEARHQLHRR